MPTLVASGADPICVDGRMLSDGGLGTGVSQYGRTLIAALQMVGLRPLILEDGGVRAHRNRTLKFIAASRYWPRQAAFGPRGFVIRDIFREAQVYFDIFGQPMPIVVPGPIGIMHWSYPLPLHIIGWRNLYTIHDAIPLDLSIPSPVNGARLRRLVRSLAASDGKFVTVSESSRQEIADRMGWSESVIACCHQGVDVSDLDNGTLPYGLTPNNYLVYVGAVEERKNLNALLDAYSASRITTPLIISGPDGLGAAAIDRRISATPGALRLGLQSRSTVLRLIADARALTLVSLAEGFGLPIAEAMTLGTPVLAAKLAAVEEISDGSVLLIDPLDFSAIRDGLIAIDRNKPLRERLVVLGRRRARHFALEPYAHRLLGLYAGL